MKLEHGKYYMMSNGKAVGPLRRVYPIVERPDKWAFYADDAGDVYEVVGLPVSSDHGMSFVSVIAGRKFPAPPPLPPTDYSAFLAELSALTMKYGVVVAGCGCCGSPYLYDSNVLGRYIVDGSGDNLEWKDG
jgi:hypothetical protein